MIKICFAVVISISNIVYFSIPIDDKSGTTESGGRGERTSKRLSPQVSLEIVSTPTEKSSSGTKAIRILDFRVHRQNITQQ